MTVEPTRHLIRVDEFEQMISRGIYGKSDRMELLNGEIIEMAPIGERHAAKVDRLTEKLVTSLAGHAVVRVQGPIRVNDISRPEPDVAVLRRRTDFYEGRLPGPDDVLLLIEVSDTSRRYDRETKLPLYADANIPVVWLVDLESNEVHVFSDPRKGEFANAASFDAGELPAVPELPQLRMQVADIFG